MSRAALLIGIGVGDPGHVTIAAVDAMRASDAIFVLDKASASSLTGIRQEIVDRYAPGTELVLVPDPPRDRSAERGTDRPDDAYARNVDTWHAARAAALAAAITEHVADGGTAGFLVWGDPSLYDSTLRVIERVGATMDLIPRVIPGITSVQALTAAHTILLNRVGEPIHITTGRRLADDDGRNTVVMLDADCTFRETAEPTDHIYWGAYLGTPDEILIDGPVGEVGERIARTRAQARERHGWIMDVYLLRRPV
ncbi:Precorrin-6A synthase (Deacetylating) OS=Tsukamurella paurometabola (strain ATCC 8368 / DSM/ CCUG 35730 / CIP 100753 / JCM 10117 / KCTC 9821 / NBRC 16120/ NCIMB 702349 / NCTC 13040) OX=521096 GN=Tpau_3353 PE=3 SV=1 [Tsukamurella paurometabola]|uniref:Precorrin-6A synthase (Deacetylating) n=1 Tax=Tsukamurella paurometabola (strain ATCC 8368 / DSM 20162 / CCUG 35730 / CIP 100753 / JCM 10117 / KCTC 9821 / NBRC 16120 / NCIMB 702349 / NCTC 13040) TaxID=521096 RepID=D5UWD8_TSUPD|nr:precorrin-6A synthase (deacetylating) [Tsukamurella paurometabola]ADG79937.1 precorrin-6A synthase (deacetylating) [Tsukamurella paurometabola DSM 20162]SUP37727.1 precorrin 6A synthase [Tsukamurella paurometabola]